MKDEDLRKGGGWADWWRFKEWISSFNRNREISFGLRAFVFDDSCLLSFQGKFLFVFFVILLTRMQNN